jgi:hypothetical protein
MGLIRSIATCMELVAAAQLAGGVHAERFVEARTLAGALVAAVAIVSVAAAV